LSIVFLDSSKADGGVGRADTLHPRYRYAQTMTN